MILVNYFARYREQLGCGGEKLPLDASLRTVEDLRQRLMARGETWAQVLGENSLMCALNQELCKLDAAIEDFDEIAFFPQVTGGLSMSIQVQTQALSLDQLNAGLQAGDASVGGVVTFVGYVRDLNLGEAVHSLFLEHYPGMTERSLQRIVEQAQARWPLNRVSLVHRVGLLQVGEPIVFVGVASAHRQAAFEACAFIMDYLKTRAPFWKREVTPAGERWINGRESDRQAAERWGVER